MHSFITLLTKLKIIEQIASLRQKNSKNQMIVNKTFIEETEQ